ncbi:formyl transferase [Shewanella bicestrii]
MIKVLLLCGNSQSSRIVYNSLKDVFLFELVIVENKPSSKLMIKRRIKKLGFLRTFGQVCFIFFNKLLSIIDKDKIVKLLDKYQLSDEYFPNANVKNVSSINEPDVVALIKSVAPDVIIVNGTRIISNKLINSVGVPMINTHMGITPKYRGVHGGYWALANDDTQNCGVTVHLVDEGVDTGGVLYQDTIKPSSEDTFNTYPLHQIAAAIPLIKKAIVDIYNRDVKTQPGIEPSILWYHPTLYQYFYNRMIKGVK